MHAETVGRSGWDTRQVAMPDLIGIFGQHDAVQFTRARRIENAHFGLSGSRGEYGEVSAAAVPRSAPRMGAPFSNRRC